MAENDPTVGTALEWGFIYAVAYFVEGKCLVVGEIRFKRALAPINHGHGWKHKTNETYIVFAK